MSAFPDIRVGSGFDVHAYVVNVNDAHVNDESSILTLAALTWPGEPGLSGHSDGDVVCHAVVDALLSAAGLGDIGSLVGVDETDTKNAASSGFVRTAVTLLLEHDWRPVNVSVQIIGNRPKFSPRRGEAERAMSELVGAPVSLSATTSDGLGFTGRGEGIAAIATALITRSSES